MKYEFNDGGRAAAGYKGFTGDCVCRAICIAAQLPYQQVYDALSEGNAMQRKTKGAPKRARTASNGVHVRRKWFQDYMKSLGFTWVPTMLVGQGCKVHLKDGELPMGRLVVSVSKHYTAVIDGVIYDTHDPSDRGATIYGATYPEYLLPKGAYKLEGGDGWAYSPDRCVYGYYIKN